MDTPTSVLGPPSGTFLTILQWSMIEPATVIQTVLTGARTSCDARLK